MNIAIKSLKNIKSLVIDNVPSELLKGGGDASHDIITKLCQKVWSTNQWPYVWSTYLIIPIPKKGDLNKFSNYITIILICHTIKIILRIILIILIPKAEDIISEEQAGFRKNEAQLNKFLTAN